MLLLLIIIGLHFRATNFPFHKKIPHKAITNKTGRKRQLPRHWARQRLNKSWWKRIKNQFTLIAGATRRDEPLQAWWVALAVNKPLVRDQQHMNLTRYRRSSIITTVCIQRKARDEMRRRTIAFQKSIAHLCDIYRFLAHFNRDLGQHLLVIDNHTAIRLLTLIRYPSWWDRNNVKLPLTNFLRHWKF